MAAVNSPLRLADISEASSVVALITCPQDTSLAEVRAGGWETLSVCYAHVCMDLATAQRNACVPEGLLYGSGS